MKILAVDTSSKVASCALVADGKLMAECVLNNGLTHSETILPMIDDVMKKSGQTPQNIDVFAVANGPGSFTGLRIGVATVKGLALAAKKKAVGINTLLALCYNLPFCPYLISPIMDARRGEVYNAFYKLENGELKEITAPRGIALADCLAELKKRGEKVVFLGDGVAVFKDTIKEELGDLALFAPENACEQRASSVCMAAFAKIEKIGDKEEKLAPFYIRKSQAERELEERGNRKC